MKLLRITMLLAIVTALTGCVSQRADAFFPEGKADKARYTRTGKFSSTTVEAEKFVKTADKVTAERITLKHSNAWMPNIELTVEGYERTRDAKEKEEQK